MFGELLDALDADREVATWERWVVIDKLPIVLVLPFVYNLSDEDSEGPSDGPGLLMLPVLIVAWPVIEIEEAFTGRGPFKW